MEEAIVKWHVASIVAGMEQASSEATDLSIAEAEEELDDAAAVLSGIGQALFERAALQSQARNQGEGK